MMNHDIFISYSSKQKSIADGVCHYLEENGFKCWMAPRDIPVGSDYGDLIEEAIKKSKAVVLVFSEAASISKWVKGEINVAFSENKTIFPFRVDSTPVEGGFRVMLNQMHWIDAFPHYASRLPELLESICSLLGRRPTTIINESEKAQKQVENRPIKDSSKKLAVPEGAIDGLFSVSPTHKVYFSKGNLQYQASTGYWRFAEEQFEFIGKENENISPNYNGWIDLFGWGTGNDPTKSTKLGVLYRLFVSWGINNIVNGGNNQWCTLTSSEWEYLLEKRQTPSGLFYAKARVLHKTGLVLLPDNWTTNNYAFNNPNCKNVDFDSNVLNASQWDALEDAGAVFLPTAGIRTGNSVSGMRGIGCYWAMDDFARNNAIALWYTSGLLIPQNTKVGRSTGCSVRLVCYAD